MGIVYQAHDLTLNRSVALKLLPTRLARNEVCVQRFLREGRAAARLSHPNIVQIYAVGRANGRYYIAMELAKGATVAELIRREGAVPPETALEISLQVAEALRESHSRGIIHRDVKPGNIIVNEQNHVKVVDFGLARTVEPEGRVRPVGTCPGTPVYMSPEHVRGEALDGRTDIYSLGITLFEMLTGKPPFEADAPWALMHQALNRPLPKIATVNPLPTGAAAIVRQMTARDRNKRYGAADDLIQDLKACLEGTPKPPRQLRMVLSGWFGRGAPHWRIAACLCMVLALAGTVGTFWGSRMLSGQDEDGPEPALATERVPIESPLPEAQEDEKPQLADTTAVEAPLAPESSPTAAEEVDEEEPAVVVAPQFEPGETRTFAGLEFVWIPPGTFHMGSPPDKEGRNRDELLHEVTLTRGFWLGKYEVTRGQWQEVMGYSSTWGVNTNRQEESPDLPVTHEITWDACLRFCDRLSELNPGRFRLPTEAEWEFACRAGTETPFAFGETLTEEQAGCRGPAYWSIPGDQRPEFEFWPVGTFPPNQWGLHDMHGNADEWCRDWYGGYPEGSVTDPLGPTEGKRRVVRGGVFSCDSCRSAARMGGKPGYATGHTGFRVVREP